MWLAVALVLILTTAACDAGPAGPYDGGGLAAVATSAAATATALPAAFMAATGTAAVGTQRAADARAATVDSLAAAGTSAALTNLGTRQAADARASVVAASATAAALGAQAQGTAAAVVYATDRARKAAEVESWRAWAWAVAPLGAFILLTFAVVWRVGLIIESVSAWLLAGAKLRMAEASHTTARTALITGAVTLLENPEFTLRDNWRGQVLKFAELAEPMNFSERVMAQAGISFEKSRLFAGILQGGGALLRTNNRSRWADGWSLDGLREAVGLGTFDNLFPRQDGALLAPPALS